MDGFTTSSTDHAGITTSATRRYTESGIEYTQTDGHGNTTTTTTDVAGHPTSITDAAGNTTSIIYGASCDRAALTTDPPGHTTCHCYEEDDEISGEATEEVGCVLSDIITEKNIEERFYYSEGNQYLPLVIKCRILKVRRYKQILYVCYVYVVPNEIELEDVVLSLNKESFFPDISKEGQRYYDRCLRQLCKITDVYKISDEGPYRIPNGFKTMLPVIKALITLKF